MRWLVLIAMCAPSLGWAESVIAQRSLRAHTVVGPDDVTLLDKQVDGAARDLAVVEGLELRTAVYKGQPILLSNLTAPALVERNQIVTLLFDSGAVTISVQGRALERGGLGDQIRVMNTVSRMTVQGVVAAGGFVRVNPDT